MLAYCNCREMKFPGSVCSSMSTLSALISYAHWDSPAWRCHRMVKWKWGRDDNNNIIPLHCCLLPVGNISCRAGAWSSGAWLIMKYSWRWTPCWSGISLSVYVVLVKGVSHQRIYGTHSVKEYVQYFCRSAYFRSYKNVSAKSQKCDPCC